MKQTSLLIICTFLVAVASAQVAKYSNEFLQIGVGARAQAMGHTGVALSKGPYAAYWNPALLTDQTREMELAGMHAEWFAGVGKYDYLGLGYHKDKSKHYFAASVIRFGVDDIPNTLSLYNNDGTINLDNVVPFSAADYALMGSYARYLVAGGTEINWGSNVKVIYRHIGSFAQSFGFGLDAALHVRRKAWNFGLVARDFTNTFNAWSFSLTPEEEQLLLAANNSLPINSVELTRPTLVLGFGHTKNFKKDWQLKTELDLLATTDGKRNTLVSTNSVSINPNLGVEVVYKKLVALRGGLHQWQKDTRFSGDAFWTATATGGVGVMFRRWHLDYAFASPVATGDKAYTHVVSLMYELK